MARKRRDGREKPPAPAARPPATPPELAKVSGEGGKRAVAGFFWLFSLSLIILGYYFLIKADPGGRNLWSSLSPAFLLVGYLLVIPAIVASYPDKE